MQKACALLKFFAAVQVGGRGGGGMCGGPGDGEGVMLASFGLRLQSVRRAPHRPRAPDVC